MRSGPVLPRIGTSWHGAFLPLFRASSFSPNLCDPAVGPSILKITERRIEMAKPFIDLTGIRYGRLVVQSVEQVGSIKWADCVCDCGVTKRIRASSLGRHTVSCGCYGRENASRRLKDRQTTHGETRTRLYVVWRGMIDRCERVTHKNYDRYGGRGITIYPAWRESYEAFAAAVGPRPKGGTLDRIDNDLGYQPGNVRWTDASTQNRNRSNNVYIEVGGERLCVAAWAEKLGVPAWLISYRHKRQGQPYQAVVQKLLALREAS
jgi:hypothetical protein